MEFLLYDHMKQKKHSRSRRNTARLGKLYMDIGLISETAQQSQGKPQSDPPFHSVDQYIGNRAERRHKNRVLKYGIPRQSSRRLIQKTVDQPQDIILKNQMRVFHSPEAAAEFRKNNIVVRLKRRPHNEDYNSHCQEVQSHSGPENGTFIFS